MAGEETAHHGFKFPAPDVETGTLSPESGRPDGVADTVLKAGAKALETGLFDPRTRERLPFAEQFQSALADRYGPGYSQLITPKRISDYLQFGRDYAGHQFEERSSDPGFWADVLEQVDVLQPFEPKTLARHAAHRVHPEAEVTEQHIAGYISYAERWLKPDPLQQADVRFWISAVRACDEYHQKAGPGYEANIPQPKSLSMASSEREP